MISKIDFVAAIDVVRKFWRWFLITGILLIILGVLCVGKAQTATLSILTLGWILVISAAAWLACGLYGLGVYGFSLYFPDPIIQGVIGYLLIRRPNVNTGGVLIAFLLIAFGFLRGSVSIVYKLPAWRWALFSGLIAFGLGAYLLTTWHEVDIYFLGMAIGIDLICHGAVLIGFARAIHRLPEAKLQAA